MPDQIGTPEVDSTDTSERHPLVERFLIHIEKERRLSSHTIEGYQRDILLLLRLTESTPLVSMVVTGLL